MALVPYLRKRGGDLARLHHDMDDLFGAFFGNWPEQISMEKLWPAIDIAENENNITVKAEVPGCKAEDIDISVHGNTLTISGEKKQSQEKKEKDYYYKESSYGSFKRVVALNSDVDTTKINAECRDGILEITLPKVEKEKAVKVKVKS